MSGTVLDHRGHRPRLGADAWLAPSATVVGAVNLGPRVSVWFGAVVRADLCTIDVDADSNLQDGVVVHTDPGLPVIIGRRVSVGHRAILHGCRIEDLCLVGMGSVVLNGAVVGTGSIIAAGAVVAPGTVVPPNSLVVGVPGRVRRSTTAADREQIDRNAVDYLSLTRSYTHPSTAYPTPTTQLDHRPPHPERNPHDPDH